MLIRMGVLQEFSPLRYRTFISLEKCKFVLKSPSPKPHLNQTGSVSALSKYVQSPCP